MQLMIMLRRLLHENRGATAVEYGLIVALLVIAIITAMHSVADQNTGLWGVVSRNINTATGS